MAPGHVKDAYAEYLQEAIDDVLGAEEVKRRDEKEDSILGLFQSEPKWMNAYPRKAQKAVREMYGHLAPN